MKIIENTPNRISTLRLVLSAVLLFLTPLTASFYTVYILGGMSDMADGAVARRTNTQSDFGARLDSAADLVFFAVCVIKLAPLLTLKRWLIVWIAMIALVKLSGIAWGFVREGKLVMPHTLANKLTGVMLFVLPLTMGIADVNRTAIPVCAAATFAAVQEIYLIQVKNTDVSKGMQL